MNDSAMYTGLDNEPVAGMFGNETLDDGTVKTIQDQERQLKELTPKLQELLDIIDTEVKSVMSIDRFLTATAQPEADIRAELQAAALYKNYLGNLKTKFTLAMNEAKKSRNG